MLADITVISRRGRQAQGGEVRRPLGARGTSDLGPTQRNLASGATGGLHMAGITFLIAFTLHFLI